MQFLISTLIFLTPALALPSTLQPRGECTPIAYRCHPVLNAPTGEGWDVCTAEGNWVYGGACGPDQQCVFNAANGSPYCLDAVAPTCTTGASVCTPAGVQKCVNGAWTVTPCAAGETCQVNSSNDAVCTPPSPHCIPATYRCGVSHNGWDVCDVTGTWVNGGECASWQTCKFNTLNGSPYCLP